MTAAWLFLVGALASTAFAQLGYKLYFRAGRQAYLTAAVVLFVGASLFAYLALQKLTVGMVYMSTAVTQLLVAGLAWGVLGERLTRDHFIALALIVSGVVLYAQ